MKVVEMAKTLGLPDTATEAQVYGEIFRLQHIIDNQIPPDIKLVALAKAKGGDLRAALAAVAAERPEIVRAWRANKVISNG